MKYIFYGLVLFALACNKNYLNVNNNPNAPSSGAPSLTFTNAVTFTATIINGNGGSGFGDFANLNYPMSYESLSSNYQVAYNITRNNYTSTDFAGVWTDIYHNLNDYLQVEQGATAGGEPFLVASAKVMEALDYQMLVDAYNDVPFSKALQLSSGVTNPAYDPAQDIYNACLGRLDTAITILESDSVTGPGMYNPGSADVMFGGSSTSWVQLANTIKLRILMHEVNVSSQASAIQAEAAKIAADPNGCLGAGQTAFVNPGYATDASNHLNPLWSTIGYTITGALANADQSANSYFIAKLGSFNDPRSGFFYLCNPSTGLPAGNPFGIPTNASATYVGSGAQTNSSGTIYPYNVSTTQTLWGILQSPTQPSVLVSSWESLFLQAEAIERGLLPGGDAAARSAYEAAITDNFTYLNVYTDGNTNGAPSAFASTYYGQSLANVGWTSSPDKIQAIITQKYISLCFTNVEEAWTDYRRTGYPNDLPLSTDPAALYPRVLRFIYPQSEYDSNKENVEKEGTVSPVSPKIFWMP